MDKVTERVYVCEADLKEGQMRGLKVEFASLPKKRHQWLLVVKHRGKYHLLDAACAHSGYPLHTGKLDGNGVITCALHYAKFDCVTGQVVSEPAICENQVTFEIEVADGKVYWLRESDAGRKQ